MAKSSAITQYKHRKNEDPGSEIWRIIPGFDGLYEINYHGTIRKTRGRGIRTITPEIKQRATVVRLTDQGGIRKEYRLSALVAKAFLAPAPAPGMVLYHPNGARRDNCAGNLEWITREKLGKITGAETRSRSVIKLDKQGEIVDFYPSARSAGKSNFMSYQTIIDRCNGKCKSKFAPDGFRYEWEGDDL